MTPLQVFAVACLGGLAAVVSLFLAAALAAGLYVACDRLIDYREERRERRRIIAEHQAQLDALPTTEHPKE